MKLFLTDQSNQFDQLLKILMVTPTMTFNKNNLTEKTTSITITKEKNLHQLNLDFLFDYKIFPSNILTYKSQWSAEKREMQTGDTILQQVTIPPIKWLCQKIVFGVRVNKIIREGKRKGFSYETIEGHVERGESIFMAEETEQGVIFTIKTFSEPGNLLTRMAGPVFTLPYQAYCTRQALNNVKNQLTS